MDLLSTIGQHLSPGMLNQIGDQEAAYRQLLPALERQPDNPALNAALMRLSMANGKTAEARAAAGPILGFLGKAVGAMLATQVGSGLGALAGEVLSVSEAGVPLGEPGRAALVPANVAVFAEGLDVGEDDVLLYLALREAAHQLSRFIEDVYEQ